MKKWLIHVLIVGLVSNSNIAFAGFLETLAYKGPVKEVVETETRGYPDWPTQIITTVCIFDEKGKMTSRVQRKNGKTQQKEFFDSKERLLKQENTGSVLLAEYDETKRTLRMGDEKNPELKEVGTLDGFGNILEISWEHQGKSYKTVFTYTPLGIVQEEKVYSVVQNGREEAPMVHRKYNQVGQEISLLIQNRTSEGMNKLLTVRGYDQDNNLIRITQTHTFPNGKTAFVEVQENKYIESSRDKYGNYMEWEVLRKINSEEVRKSKVTRKITYYEK